MYRPSHFAEDRPDVLVAAMREIQLGAFITPTPTGIEITHIPTVVHHVAGQEQMVIEAHLSRANPHWKALTGQPSAVIFQGAQSYISPSWYPSKKEHEKVVPTWGYIVVHAHGRIETMHDAEWLSRHLNELTQQNEAHREDPWEVSDAPEKYVAALIRGIVGLRFTVERLEGTWKINQNMSDADIEGTARGLATSGEMGVHLATALRQSREYPSSGKS